jgi:hypothetical protein
VSASCIMSIFLILLLVYQTFLCALYGVKKENESISHTHCKRNIVLQIAFVCF